MRKRGNTPLSRARAKFLLVFRGSIRIFEGILPASLIPCLNRGLNGRRSHDSMRAAVASNNFDRSSPGNLADEELPCAALQNVESDKAERGDSRRRTVFSVAALQCCPKPHAHAQVVQQAIGGVWMDVDGVLRNVEPGLSSGTASFAAQSPDSGAGRHESAPTDLAHGLATSATRSDRWPARRPALRCPMRSAIWPVCNG